MIRYIAFLRAINVGGHNVKMDRLRQLFEELGFANVQTFIASGNVIFETADTDASALEDKIEHQLRQGLGYTVDTFLRTAAEVAAIAEYEPFPGADMDAEETGLYITFLSALPNDEAQAKLMTYQNEVDEFHFHQREFYWLRRKKLSDAAYPGPPFDKINGAPATMRNATTVRKLAAKYAGSK